MQSKGRVALLAVAVMVLSSIGASGNDDDASRAHVVPRTADKIAVDAVLDEAAWSAALKLELKYETDPGENIPALVKSEVLVIYDDSNVYFALRCFDPDPSAIRARFSDRDTIGGDDIININLDTFNDERRNYFFGVNALGIQRDGIETPLWTDNSWDAIWDSAGRITADGYIIEMAVPFTSIQFQRKTGPQVWGLDISRWYPRSVRHRLGLVPIDRNNNSYQAQFLKIKGFEGITPGRNIEIVPTITATRSDARQGMPDGDFQAVTKQAEAGITAQWGLTPNLTMSGTLNPDFSQVEADARQLDINQPFALFYFEKRPFFLEGADFFRTPLDVVYTRTMRDPVWGLKATGKEGANTLGAFFVRDDLTNLIFPGNQRSQSTSLPFQSTASVLRYKRDIGRKYTFGVLTTDREGQDYFNRVVGFDGTARFTNRHKIDFQFLGSSTEYPDHIAEAFGQPAGELSGHALSLTYDYQSRNLFVFSRYSDFSGDFRADLGFMPQVDYRQYIAGADYIWINNEGLWSRFLAGGFFYRTEDRDGELLNQRYSLEWSFQGAMQSQSWGFVDKTREAYNDVEYDLLSASAAFYFQPTADLAIGVNGNFGDRIDYGNSRLGSRIRIRPNATYNLGRNTRINISHDFERMNVNDQRLYTANISQCSVVYQFNSRAFLRSIIQYVGYDYNTSNYTYNIDPEFKSLFTQQLFSYKINPRTVLFLGYSDNYFGDQDFGLAQSDRTFFMKIGYSWQL